MKKLPILFAALLLAASLAACESTPAETTAAPTVTVDPEADYVPEAHNYANHEFRILTAGNVAFDDFAQTEASEVVLDNAQYLRRTKVETDFGVQIVSEVDRARSMGDGPGFRKISQSVYAGETTYDAAMIGGYDVSVLACNDMLYDLYSLPSLDLTRSWWDQNANRELAIRDVLFFTTGDITVADNNAVFSLLFNKKLIEDYGLTSPYDYVHDDNWTLDTFGTLVKSVSQDLNADGTFDENDRFGLLVWDDAVMGIINSIGEKCASVGSDGRITLTLYNDRTIAALEKYFDIIFDETSAICYQRKLKTGSGIWNNNQGLFWQSTLGNVPTLRDMEADFGIVPYPKMDASQTDYHHTISPYNSQFWCVPKILEDGDRTGRLLDALAYYGQKIVTPAYYEKTIVGQSARDEESVEMLDIILSTMTFDFGYYYQVGTYNNELIYMVRQYDRNFTSRYETYKNAAESKLDQINTAYENAVATWKQ